MAETLGAAHELAHKSAQLAEKGEHAAAQVWATLAQVAALEELTQVVRMLAPRTAPDPDAGVGYTEFEMSQDVPQLELDEAPAEVDVDLDE